MNRLNVFNNSYFRWRNPLNWVKNLKIFFKSVKWAKQRITRGFADIDWWDLDCFYIDLITDSLNYFAEHTISYDDKYTPEEYKEKILKLASKFKYIGTDSDELNPYYEDYSKFLEGRALFDENKQLYPNFQNYIHMETEIEKKKQEAVSPELVRIEYVNALENAKRAEARMVAYLKAGGYIDEK